MKNPFTKKKLIVLIGHPCKDKFDFGSKVSEDGFATETALELLHPSKQRKQVRKIAKRINKGMKIVICTHSDYVIKELNILIMLDKADFKDKDGMAISWGYKKTHALNPKDVAVFKYKKNGKCKAVKVGDSGFTDAGIDDVIWRQDSATEVFYHELKENNTKN